MNYPIAIFILVLVTLSAVIPGATAIRCLECDTLTHPSCAYSQNTTLTVPLVECEEDGQCYISLLDAETKRVVRGCRNDDHCAEFGCFLCPWDDCNDLQYIEEKCVSCTTDSANSFCEWGVGTNFEAELCPDTTFERSGCFLHIKDNVYTRDCVANMDDEMFEECQRENYCKICSEDGCNSRDEFPRCYTCDSERDENCVYRPDGRYIQQCENYSDHCVAFTIADGKTVRGCSSEIEDSDPTYCPSTNCLECSNVECNSQLVPGNRKMCYQCDGSQAGCLGDQTMLQSYRRACNIFNYEDRCFTYVDDSGFGYRGCMSDQTVQSALCAAEPEKCTICDADNCNSEFIERDSELFCYSCSEDEEDCPWRPKIPDQPATCQTKVTQNNTDIESCYYFKFENGEVRRGCTLDDTEFCAEHECNTCSGNYCNSEVAEPQTCIQCTSEGELYPTCEEDARDLNSLACDEEPYYDDRGCYSFKDDEDLVLRGCWNAVADEHKALCEAEDNTDDRCNKCFGNGCNTYDHSDSVTLLAALPLVFVSTISPILFKYMSINQ